MVAVSAHQRIEDGMVFFRSSNNVILTEGFGGLIEALNFRFVIRLRRNPQRRRRILWEPYQSHGGIREPLTDAHPETLFTQTNPDAVETEHGAVPTPSSSVEEPTEWPDEPLGTADLGALEGGGAFSDASSDYTHGRITDDQSMSSVMTRTDKEEVREEVLLPHPSLRMAKLEEGPIFATQKRSRSGGNRWCAIKSICRQR